MDESARYTLLKALRSPGNETQLTRAVSALASLVTGLAGGLARAVLATAAAAGNSRAGALLLDVPRSITVSNERNAGPVKQGRRAAGGFIDWHFRGENFDLLVEVKLAAALGENQIERYLRASRSDGTRGGLILLTTTAPTLGDVVRSHDRWLGHIRWGGLLPRLASVAADNPAIANEWRLLLRVLDEPGDLKEREARATSPYRRHHQRLSAVVDDAASLVAAALAKRLGRPSADRLCVAQPAPRTRKVIAGRTGGGGSARFQLYVPGTPTFREMLTAEDGPAIEVELSGSRAPYRLTTRIYPVQTGRRRASSRALHESGIAALEELNFSAAGNCHEAEDRVSFVDRSRAEADFILATLAPRLQAIVHSGLLDRRVR